MARINAVLDEEVDYGFEGGARYKTNIAEMENGFTDKDAGWKYSIHEFHASFGDIDEDVRDFLIEVFHACRGRLHSFKFKDWNDYRIVDQPIKVLPGTAAKIQLYKVYQPDGWPAYTIRPIQAFNFCKIVDENGDPVAGTLNKETGEFTPDEEWGNGEYRIEEAEFYVWVYFDDDYNSMTINSWRAHTAKVTLVEDRFDFDAENVPDSWDGDE